MREIRGFSYSSHRVWDYVQACIPMHTKCPDVAFSSLWSCILGAFLLGGCIPSEINRSRTVGLKHTAVGLIILSSLSM